MAEKSQHWIARLYCKDNSQHEILSRYFDGTRGQALRHFRKDPVLMTYSGISGYYCTVAANSFELFNTVES